MQTILRDKYYNVGKEEENRYLIQIWSQAKASGIKLPEVYRIDKGVDPNVKPEKQIIKPPNLAKKSNPQIKPRLGQGKAYLRSKMKTPVQMQPQLQTIKISQIKEQSLPKQKEGIQTPLTNLTTDRHLEHLPEMCIVPDIQLDQNGLFNQIH